MMKTKFRAQRDLYNFVVNFLFTCDHLDPYSYKFQISLQNDIYCLSYLATTTSSDMVVCWWRALMRDLGHGFEALLASACG